MHNFCIPLPNQTVSPVGGENNDGSDGALKCSMEVCEAFNVQHVHLVNKKDSRYELRYTLVDVAVHYFVNLSAQFI